MVGGTAVNGKTKKEAREFQRVSDYVFNALVARGDITGNNSLISRRSLVERTGDERRDIDAECGYPQGEINYSEYLKSYKREGVGRRAVTVYPEECWSINPDVYETEKGDDTAFEKAWKELVKEHNLYHYLEKVDEISGIGRFGVLYLGFDDNKEPRLPINGIDLRTGKPSKASTGQNAQKLLYVRPLEEACVAVSTWQTDVKHPRYGLPELYTLTLKDPNAASDTSPSVNMSVHWTRVIHVADNCMSSRVFGTPRQEIVYNRLLDLKKVLGGSGEMFWRGAFPGLSIEAQATTDGIVPQLDIAATRSQMDAYQNGLQRYIALVGAKAQSLSPQIADPRFHLEGIMDNIALSIGIPKRILFGTEEAKLAATQDVRTWNLRISRRQNNYVTPCIVVPFAERMVAVGVLPSYSVLFVEWPDRNTLTEDDKANVALKKTQALVAYAQGGADVVVPPAEFLRNFLYFSHDQVNANEEALSQYLEEDKPAKDAAVAASDKAANDVVAGGPSGEAEQADLNRKADAAKTKAQAAKKPPAKK